MGEGALPCSDCPHQQSDNEPKSERNRLEILRPSSAIHTTHKCAHTHARESTRDIHDSATDSWLISHLIRKKTREEMTRPCFPTSIVACTCFICPNIGLTPASDYLSRSNNANGMQREPPRVTTPLRKVRIGRASVILPSPALNLLLRLTMESVGLPAAALSGQRPVTARGGAPGHCPPPQSARRPGPSLLRPNSSLCTGLGDCQTRSAEGPRRPAW